jgi:hypothetical protein
LSHTLTVQELKQSLESFEQALGVLEPLSSSDIDRIHTLDEHESKFSELINLKLERIKPCLHQLNRRLSTSDWLPFLEQLTLQLWLYLSNQATSLAIQTRLSLWERLWISIKWRHGQDTFERHRLTQEDQQKCLDFIRSLTQVSLSLKTDPGWGVRHVHDQKESFFAEESLCYVLNRFDPNLRLNLAPLVADVLYGVDLSARRKNPRAKGWLQVTLSGEKELNLKKLNRLRSSAAVAIVSPWTLSEFLLSAPAPLLFKTLKDLGHEHPIRPNHNFEGMARFISQEMRRLFGVTKQQIDQVSSTSKYNAIMSLISLFIHAKLGQKARRSYKVSKIDIAIPTAISNRLADLD